jgi:predicted acetyltransferase
MEYRMLRSDELTMFRRAEEYCFHIPPADYDSFVEHKLKLEETRAIFGDDGEFKAGLINYPLTLYMGGAKLGMGGVAGVVSLPESRREGYVGEVLRRLIAEEKEKGVPLSGLYPFKQAFYRRFGWELSAWWLWHTIAVEELAPYRRVAGHVSRHTAAEADWLELERIYSARHAREYGYVARETESFWQDWTLPAWGKLAFYAAVWRPVREAQAEGYLIYRFNKADDGHMELIVRELVALTQAAERGLWGFVAQHDSQIKHVRYRTPRDYPLSHLVENTRAVKSTLESGWMLRFIDVKAAFEGRPWPGVPNGSLTLGITDEQAPWNAGTWRLTFESGRATLVPAAAETPALSASVNTWIQLYAGALRPAQAVASGCLACSDDGALRLLAQATGGAELWFYEFF